VGDMVRAGEGGLLSLDQFVGSFVYSGKRKLHAICDGALKP
jgi:hypothetical protein